MEGRGLTWSGAGCQSEELLWMEVFMDRRHERDTTAAPDTASPDEPAILEEIEVEDLAVDGICGVY